MQKSPIDFDQNVPIECIEIFGLFGERKVRLDIDNPVTILVADNGSGKTTVLNILHSIFSSNIRKLSRYEFDSIVIHPTNDKKIVIDHDIFPQRTTKESPIVDLLIAEGFNIADAIRLVDIAGNFRRSEFLLEYEVKWILKKYRTSPLKIRGVIYGENWGQKTTPLFRMYQLEIESRLSAIFQCENLYLPTYRRIEEDLDQLLHDTKSRLNVFENKLIQFGMDDVKQRQSDILDKIQKIYVEAYSKASGDMLSQMLDSNDLSESSIDSLTEDNRLNKVLDRLGKTITIEHRNKIAELINSSALKEKENTTLAYFLVKLASVHDQQKHLESSITDYVSVCNKYIKDKLFTYNEQTLQINAVHRKSGRDVDLSKLSSGEKQIVSLFSKLYLESSVMFTILFDEPELSLSIDWQQMILPDIFRTNRCRLLIATTHSPFIFDNEFDKYACKLNECVE